MTQMELLAGVLLHFVWQGILIAAVTEAALTLTRETRTRYAIACTGLAAMAMAPLFTAPWLAHSLPTTTIALVGTVPAAPADWVVRMWGIGLAVLSLRLMLDQYRVSRLRSRSIAGPPGLRAMTEDLIARMAMGIEVEVRIVAGLATPMAVGILEPVVLLPATLLTGLTPDQLRAIVAHELAHIHRLDAVVNLLQVLVETMLYYHPAVWWISRRIRIEREFCCDEAVVSACGNPIGYARALADLEEGRATPRLTQAAQGGNLMERIKRIVGTPAEPRQPRWTWPALGAACALGLVSVALAGPVDADDEGALIHIAEHAEHLDHGEHGHHGHHGDLEIEEAHGVIMIEMDAGACGEGDCVKHLDVSAEFDMGSLREHAEAMLTGLTGDGELPAGTEVLVLRENDDGELVAESNGTLVKVRERLSEHGVDLETILIEAKASAIEVLEDADVGEAYVREIVIDHIVEVEEDAD